MTGIPVKIWRLYKGSALPLRLLAWARTLICPFEELVGHVPRAATQVVELGCGTGVFANLVALDRPGCRVAGYDVSEKAIRAARRTVGERRNIRFELRRVEEVGLERGVRVVAAIDLFHHLAPAVQEDVLRAVYAGLDHGGVLLLKDIETEPQWKYRANWLHDAVMAPGDRIHCRSRAEFRRLLEITGFEVEVVPMHRLWYSHVLYVARKR